MTIRLRHALGVALMLCITPSATHAQNSNDVNSGIQFDFSLAGARSQAMGGAFVALADDATTIFGNPSGLSNFTLPEFSAEIRRSRWASRLPDSGHAFGLPSGIGQDIAAGVIDRTSFDSRTTLPFLSFVYPAVKNWSFGGFARDLAQYSMSRERGAPFFSCSGGYRGGAPAPPFCEPHAQADAVDRMFPAQQELDLSIRGYGGSVAYLLVDRPATADGGAGHKLSIGVGAQVVTFDIDATNHVFSIRGDKKFQAPDFSLGNIELTSTEDGRDVSWSPTLGLHWAIGNRWSVGAAYQQGPTFQFRLRAVTGPANLSGSGVVVADDPRSTFKVPDQFAAGVTFKLNPYAAKFAWQFSAQYDRVQFSQLLADFKDTVVPTNDPERVLLVERLVMDDVNRIRIGAEHLIFLRPGRVLALRGGLFYDPQHQLYFTPDDVTTGLPVPRSVLYYPKGRGDLQVSAGGGFTMGRTTIHAAATFADQADALSISAVVQLDRRTARTSPEARPRD